MALLHGFEALGTETWMAVATKHTDDPRVLTFYDSPHVDYTPEHPISRARLAMRRNLDSWLGIEDFNHPYTRHVTELAGEEPDVVLCNNLHGRTLLRPPPAALPLPANPDRPAARRRLELHRPLRGAGRMRAMAHAAAAAAPTSPPHRRSAATQPA